MCSRWLVAGALCAGLVACGGGKAEDKPAPTPTPGEAKPPPVAEAPLPPPVAPATLAATASSADLAYLPVESELVVGLDLARLSTSIVWKQLVEPLLLEGDVQARLGELRTRCGFDPVAAIKTVTAGVRNFGVKTEGVAVVRGLDQAKVLACLDKLRQDPKTKLAIAQDGDITNLTAKSGETVAVAFVDPTTAVVAFGPAAATIKTVITGKSTLPTSAAFVAIYNAINTQAPLWGLLNGSAKLLEPIQPLAQPKVIFGSLVTADGLALDARVRLETVEKATSLAKLGKLQSPTVLQMFTFDKLEITSDGVDVRVVAAATGANLQAIIKQVKSMQSGQSGQSGKMGDK